MKLDPNTLVIIPAKGNSNRIKQKNLQKINGYSLVEIALIKLLSLTNTNNIIVSSESEEIHNLLKKYGYTSKYRRPKHLTEDKYGVVDVILDVITAVQKEGRQFDTILIVLPTSPFVSKASIISAQSKFLKKNSNALMSVSRDLKTPYHSMYEVSGELLPLHPSSLIANLKTYDEYRTTYKANGAFTFLNIEAFKKIRDYYIFPMDFIELDILQGLDIDYDHELEFAKIIANKRSELLDL